MLLFVTFVLALISLVEFDKELMRLYKSLSEN